MVDVSQGVHLQMCGEVLRYLGSDTCFHIRTSPLWLAQRRYRSFAQWHYRIHYYCHAHVPSPVVSQEVHLQMCGKVLRYLRSDTCFHIRNSPLWLAQQRCCGFAQWHYRMPSSDVSQGVHLQMCGEVLQYLGSNTCFHIQTSPLWLAQRCTAVLLNGITAYNTIFNVKGVIACITICTHPNCSCCLA